ncbi:MAG: hypothetical protein MUE52_11060 [Tabrizicola sp.]|jgi:hypothetical protein|nr:hypothetical protein [Tabrizicola sp.]
MAEVIAVNRYALRDMGAFRVAVAALVRRVQDQGHPGVTAYRFFCPSPVEGRAVVTYASPEAWVTHHDLVMSWPEMAALRASADLEEVMLFGPVTSAMQNWIDRMGLGAKVRVMDEQIAGFTR